MLAGSEAEIARQAAWLPPESFSKWLSRLIRRITEPDPDPDPGLSEAERQRAASELWMKRQPDGMWRLTGQLDQQRGTELHDILQRTARHLNPDGDATANARADALHRLTTRRPQQPRQRGSSRHTDRPPVIPDSASGRQPTRSPRDGAPGHATDRASVRAGRDPTASAAETSTTQPPGGKHDVAVDETCDWFDDYDPGATMGIGYIVDAATLAAGPHETSVAQTWQGDDIDPAEVGRLACDTDCYAILYDTLGQPTKTGRTRRAATREQRLQLRGLYDRCPIDGTPFGHCDIHHVNQPWEHGGATELDNLLPISRTWHHRIHDRGWQLEMLPDRSLKIWRPDGELHRAIPPPRPISRN